MSAKKIPSPRATRPSFKIQPFTLEGWESDALKPLPDIAEHRAQLRLLEARQLREKTGRPTAQTKALEAAAERWRDLARLSEADAAPLVAGWQQAALEAIDGLLVRAGADSVAALANLLMVATRALYGLRGLAAGGNVTAGGVLMAALAKEAADFELLAWHKPEIFRAGARKLSQIPGTIGRHPDKMKGNADFADRLEVGADCEIASVPKKGQTKYWNHETPANVFALKLKSYIDYVRGMTALYDEPILPPEWFTDALALEDFSPGTYTEWAKIAWRILDNGKHRELPQRGTLIKFKELKSAFRTLATGKARTK